MKPWMVLVGFSVVFVTMAALVALDKVSAELLAAPLMGFLGWLSPAPKDTDANASS